MPPYQTTLINWILSSLFMPGAAAYCLVGYALTVGAICGRRIVYLNVPENPLLSPVIRQIGVVIFFVSKTILVSAAIAAAIIAILIFDKVDMLWPLVAVPVSGTTFGILAGVVFSLPVVYRWIPIWERGQGLDDVQKLATRLKKLSKPYDPANFIDLNKGLFLGLNYRGKPLYVPVNVIQKNHLQLVGESGSGKSSVSGLVLAQCSIAKESVIVFDPKDDEFLAGALYKVAQQHNIRFHLIDLRPTAQAQLNPLLGCEPWQIEELLVAAHELGKSGDPAVDFHRGEDRDACKIVAQQFANGADTIPKLFQACSGVSAITDRTNFWREFSHLCSLPVFQAKEGLNLVNAINTGDIIYVVGSITSDTVFTGQRLLLQRVLQIISGRERDDARPVALMIDELKYLLSVPAIRAMGTVRDRRCHMIVAHQSLGDLDDCAGLDPRAVRGAIHGNTSVKLIYKLNEHQSAIEFEGLAGKERTFIENITNREDEDRSRGWRESERPRIRADLFSHLPKPTKGEASVGVLLGLGPAQLLATRYIESGPPPQITPAESDGCSAIEELI